METFSALLALFAGNSPVTGEFSAQRPVTRSFDAFFDLRLNKRSREARDLRRHRAHYDIIVMIYILIYDIALIYCHSVCSISFYSAKIFENFFHHMACSIIHE